MDPTRPYAFTAEQERTADGRVDDVATILLTNKECSFRCLMCDLWKNTTDEPVPPGSIPAQIRWALERLPPTRHVKLYNSGSFFDPRAIPEIDYHDIANAVRGFETVIVESHPRVIGRRCLTFNEQIAGRLQVAMGLEIVHPHVLEKLNKRMTISDFEDAAETLGQHGIQVRAFILLRPPFLSEEEGVYWAKRSIDFAFNVGVECCVIIPTRAGNGAMDALARRGLFAPPTLSSIEDVLDYGVSLGRGRVFADLWDIEETTRNAPQQIPRVERLRRINLTQSPQPRLAGSALGTCRDY